MYRRSSATATIFFAAPFCVASAVFGGGVWKALRHQRLLDEVRMSDTVLGAVSSTRSLPVLYNTNSLSASPLKVAFPLVKHHPRKDSKIIELHFQWQLNFNTS